jgi:simple sugar transport system ATP-binding protein
MTDDRTVLRVEGISKRFGGVAALRDVDLDVRAGEVLCLAGANGSGKSTLIKVISGVEQADSGTITMGETTLAQLTPRKAAALGVEVIFQDFSLFPNLTVAENIGMPSYVAGERRIVRPREVRAEAAKVVARIGVLLDLDSRVEQLSVADRQLTAICRALARDAKVIFMDEPTTALTRREVDALFRIVQRLKEDGVGLVFVSHKLEEVLRVSDRIAVLRNGEVVAKGELGDFDRRAIIQAMTGHDLTEQRPEDTVAHDAEPLLRVEGLRQDGFFEDVSFDVRPGEILGITGLLGSGRTEIAEALFGVTPADGGTITVAGRRVRIHSVRDAIRAGLGYVPADRLTQGVFLDQPIATNIIAGSLERVVGRLRMLKASSARQLVADATAELKILMSSAEAPARSLSGGNQQRVVLAKWLIRTPRVLILNSPTVGVDIGSKHEILALLAAKARQGLGVIIMSDDVPELVAICHRVLVIRNGHIVEELAGERIEEDLILKELTA